MSHSHSPSFASGTGTVVSSTYLSPFEREENNSTTEGRVRAFPFRPSPEPGSLTDFVEETGTNQILIEALQKLYAVPNKPENPIEWLRLYFQYQAPDFTQEIEEMELLLKAELTELEADLINSLEVEAQNQDIIQKLEHEVKNIKMAYGKNQQHDDFRKYMNHPDNYHYRIRPDPSYQASKTDMLLGSEDESLRREDSLVEIVSFDPVAFFESESAHMKKSFDNIYDDYPALYFPEFVLKPQSDEDEDSGESEEASEGVAETEYDAGSEGGDSEESRPSRLLPPVSPPPPPIQVPTPQTPPSKGKVPK